MSKIECQCGCGQQIDRGRQNPRHPGFAVGHHPGGDPDSAYTSSPGTGTTGDYSKRISRPVEYQAFQGDLMRLD